VPVLRVEVELGERALRLLGPRWDELAGASGASPSMAAGWLRAMGEDAVARGRTPVVAVASEAGGGLHAGVALEVAVAGIGPARLRIGSWLGHPRRVFQPDVLARPGWADEAPAVLRAALRATDGIVLHDAPAAGVTARAARLAAPWARVMPGRSSLVVDPSGAAMDRRRREVAREVRAAGRKDARVEVVVASAEGAVREGLQVLTALHERRWERRDDASRFSREERDRETHRQAVPRLAHEGRAHVVVVRERGEPVAACLALVADGQGMLYRTASRPGGLLRGPGIVALVRAIDAAAEAGARRVDLGIGEEPYKARFGPEEAPAVVVVASARRALQPGLVTAVAGRRAVRALL
jgi:CelD/BcsL family acetyltransferase involved in cellulose biosynthesis